MKTKSIFLCMVTAAALAGPIQSPKPMRNPPPPIITVPATASAPSSDAPAVLYTTAYTFQQQAVTSRVPLVSQEQAKAVIERFKAGYPKLAAPRMLIYVNRELVDQTSGLRIVGRKERTDGLKADLTPTGTPSAGPLGQNVTVVGNASLDSSNAALKGTSERVVGENTYEYRGGTNSSLADKQTVRDVERLMGRPLRLGGARITDQRVATQLLADRSVQEFLGTTGSALAAKDREALQHTADVVVEILISSRSLAVPGISGDLVHQVPDIQATAIRLVDAQILGQASSADILGPDRLAGRVARNYDVREITEAVALALMEDMMQAVQ